MLTKLSSLLPLATFMFAKACKSWHRNQKLSARLTHLLYSFKEKKEKKRNTLAKQRAHSHIKILRLFGTWKVSFNLCLFCGLLLAGINSHLSRI